MDSKALIRDGDLAGARAALAAAVKAEPARVEKRFELAEVLLVQGDFERADTHLDLVSSQDTSWALPTALIRQLIRAEAERREVLEEGRTPEVAGEATPEIAAMLQILLALREGGDAGALRQAADQAAPVVSGRLNGRPFEGLRDLDDRVADVLEVLTSTGKYYWIPWRRVASLTLAPPERLRDLIWRKAELEVVDGPSGVVYLPATYQARDEALTDAHRLGRQTDWVEDAGLTRGLGQRCLLVGEDIVPLFEVQSLAVER